MALIACLILARSVSIMFMLVWLIVYISAWTYIHLLLEKYKKSYELELKTPAVAS
jgi:hypothetical protein